MNRKIIGVTVGTSISPAKLRDKMNLSEAINDALAQAKESGEFDGKDGQSGSDGVSATHAWNGTVLTVTSASGTSSADLKGDKGDKGDTGEVDYGRLNDYAKLASPNNMLHNGNEYTFIPDNYYGEVYLNHRAGGGNHNGQISNYHFCNGSGQYATIIANYFKGKFQGADDRPIYNNEEVAMLRDLTPEQVGALSANGGTVNGAITIQRENYPGFTLKNTTVNGEFAVTEADDGTALLQNNSDVTGANNYAALYIKPAEQGINNMLQIGHSVGGAWSGAVVLHSRNINDHINSENWTFTLEDGSTVTKKVYIG